MAYFFTAFLLGHERQRCTFCPSAQRAHGQRIRRTHQRTRPCMLAWCGPTTAVVDNRVMFPHLLHVRSRTPYTLCICMPCSLRQVFLKYGPMYVPFSPFNKINAQITSPGAVSWCFSKMCTLFLCFHITIFPFFSFSVYDTFLLSKLTLHSSHMLFQIGYLLDTQVNVPHFLWSLFPWRIIYLCQIMLFSCVCSFFYWIL